MTEERIERTDAIKLDVEGAEDLILDPFFEAAPETLWPRLLLVENAIGAEAAPLHAMLVARGYRSILQTMNKRCYDRS